MTTADDGDSGTGGPAQLSDIMRLKEHAKVRELARIEERIGQLREFRQEYNQNPGEHDQQEFQTCKQLLKATEEARDRLQQSLSEVEGRDRCDDCPECGAPTRLGWTDGTRLCLNGHRWTTGDSQ
ncbi:hypothetical protein [Halobacterium zhouii]|uniref:hypothetical protein n=1 Tax=Halobacterium zhouii TaxID=2902624 RepID=UPI001E2E57BE|nr:hypothetical protein [Halobacterium zhouii]